MRWGPLILYLVQEECIPMLLEVGHPVIVLCAHQACTVLRLVLHCLLVCVQLVTTALGACQYLVMSTTFVHLVTTALRVVLLHWNVMREHIRTMKDKVFATCVRLDSTVP